MLGGTPNFTYWFALLTKDPSFIIAVDNHRGWHGQHHRKIRKSQIHHQQVGWCSQGFRAAEDVNDHAVTYDGDEAQNPDHESQDAVPQWVHGWKLIPMRIDHVKHVGQHFVYDGEIATKSGCPLGCPWGVVRFSHHHRHCGNWK